MKNSNNNVEKKMWLSVESKERQKYENGYEDNRQEFSAAVQDLIDRGAGYNLDRKKFLTIMGASLAMAGLKCTKDPVEKIVPYLVRPPEAQPGTPAYYATAKVSVKGVLPVLVKTREGKPIKIDGHEEHPINKGAMTVDSFAAIWDLYDPDRLKTSKKIDGGKISDVSTADALSEAAELISSSGKVRILSRPTHSPSENVAVNGLLRRKPGATQTVYDFTGSVQSLVEAQRKSYGRGIVPHYNIEAADYILAIENDFLGTWLSPEVFTKRFSSRRTPDGKMNKLVSVESMMSLTGANADVRHPVRSGSHVAFALGLANLLLPFSAYAGNGAVAQTVAAYTPEKTSEITGMPVESLKAIADEIRKYPGKSLVLGGGVSAKTELTGELEIAVNLLNSILGNDGSTVLYDVPAAELDNLATNYDLSNLISELSSGSVDLLILDRVNPLYELPADSGFAEALGKAKKVISLSYHMDESASKSHLVIALNHFLESWGDAYYSGVYSIVQPVIRKLFDTISINEALLTMSGADADGLQFIKDTGASTYLAGNFYKLWDETLMNGFHVVRQTSGYNGPRPFNAGALAGVGKSTGEGSGFSLSLYETIALGDGQGANNAFRQELPDPITKITWENYVAISNEDAKENGWKMGDILSLKNGDKEVKLPVYIQPGLAKGSMAAAIGYGHEEMGQIAKGLGVNVSKLAKFTKSGTQTSGIIVSVKKVDSGYELATTQRHYEMEGRALVRYAELSEYQKDKHAGNHEHKQEGKGLYPPHTYSLKVKTDDYKWGMVIDLGKCTGCSACVMSCYSENNISVTGKDEVWRGREMAWLRIDRYYEGDISNPSTHFAPLPCQQCENAPCENVCPVGATTHSSEGINEMTYNRCVGTRYCLDNCPYKVRHFNFFEWGYNKDSFRDPMQMALNPDVTVRGRGVMEKCTFCVQRINEQRQLARAEGRKIRESDLKTACQQGCPANAISFGDLGSKESSVSKLASTERSYRMLEEINVEPRVNYLTRIINKG